MVIFVWGAEPLLRRSSGRPTTRCEVYVVGKQWMWKLQHLTGQREINELHVPVGRPVKLTHDLRGRDPQLLRARVPHEEGRRARAATRTVWFEATKPGSYHLFCAEYCGTQHSGMIGGSIVMEPGRVPGLARRRRPRRATSPVAAAGETLFQQLGCATCHRARRQRARARRSTGSSASAVRSRAASTVTADDDYLRESILTPRREDRRGLPADHADVPGAGERGADPRSSIAYIKSLQGAEPRRARRRRARQPSAARRRAAPDADDATT